jgi:cation-dependent mannose-6-phosphate receptor
MKTMRFLPSLLLLGIGLVEQSLAEDKTSTAADCTATSALGAFFDLRPDTAVKPPSERRRATSATRNHPTTDYHARGYDYGSNFTLNICGAVVGEIDNVRGIDKGAWANISAYYTSKGDVYSLGSQSTSITSRGRKLVLQYTGGSPCGPKNDKRTKRSLSHEGSSYRTYDDEEDSPTNKTSNAESIDAAKKEKDEKETTTRRKSATISFLCDRDSLTGTAASFIGVDPDECSYFFEVRSLHACTGASAEHKPGSVGPGSIFAIILLIAVLVYLGGGIFYNRTVANARGWRQLPNYAMWSGIWNFISVG